MSPSISDDTPLSQVTSHLDLAESFACQSGRHPEFPNIGPEAEESIFIQLRKKLTSRNKLVQVQLLDKYLKSCLKSPRRCPPLPLTGIKACLYILNVKKPTTGQEQIKHLANIYEDWRATLVVDVGPKIAGIDSIWKCKALTQLVSKPPSPVENKPFPSNGSSLSVSTNGPLESVSTKSPPQTLSTLDSRAPIASVEVPVKFDRSSSSSTSATSATPNGTGLPTIDPVALESDNLDSVPPCDRMQIDQETTHGTEIDHHHVKTTPVETLRPVLPLDTRPVSLLGDVTVTQPDTSLQPQSATQAGALSSNHLTPLSLSQSPIEPTSVIPTSPDGLSIETKEWLTALRSLDEALTNHLNVCPPQSRRPVGVPTSYRPDPSLSTYYSSYKPSLKQAPLSTWHHLNTTIVISAPAAFDISAPCFVPNITKSPTLRPATSPLGSNVPGPSSTLTTDAGCSQRTLVVTETRHLDNNPAEPQKQAVNKSHLELPQAVASDQSHSSQLLREVSNISTSHETTQSPMPSCSNPNVLKPPIQLEASQNPRPPTLHNSPSQPVASTSDIPQPPIKSAIVPILPEPKTFNKDQENKFLETYTRVTDDGKTKLVSILHRSGYGDYVEALLAKLSNPTRQRSQSANAFNPTIHVSDATPSTLIPPTKSHLPEVSSSQVSTPTLTPNPLDQSPSVLLPPPSSTVAPLKTHVPRPNSQNSSILRTLNPPEPSPESLNVSSASPHASSSRVPPTPGPSSPAQPQLDPTLKMRLHTLLSRGPQPLGVILTAFSQHPKDTIMLHARSVAYPLSGQPNAPWVLREPIQGAYGSSLKGSSNIDERLQRPSYPNSNKNHLHHTTLLGKGTSLPPTSTGSLLGAVPTGFPVQKRPNGCISVPPLPTSRESSENRTAHQGNQSHRGLSDQVTPFESNTGTGTSRRRSLPSDADDVPDLTDTLTDTTQGSSSINREEGQQIIDLTKNGRNLRRRTDHRTLHIHATRNIRFAKSKSPVVCRVGSPPAFNSSLEPFEDDLPGFPAVDRTVQTPGSRAKILVRYDVDEQMAPFRTFVPMSRHPRK